MLWCQGAQDIGLSNHKLKSVLTCSCAPYNHNACLPQMDRKTNDHHGNSVAIHFNKRCKLPTYTKVNIMVLKPGLGSSCIICPGNGLGLFYSFQGPHSATRSHLEQTLTLIKLINHRNYSVCINPFNGSCSKLLLSDRFSDILV